MKRNFPLIIYGILLSPKMNNVAFASQAHVRKSRNNENEGFEVSSHTQIEKL